MNKLQYLGQMQEEWSSCRGCQLCEERNKVVFGYGQVDQVPIYDSHGDVITMGGQVMIIGEAPGENEDRSGFPFVGQAGLLLDQYLGCVSARDEVINAWQAVASKERMPEAQRNEWRMRLREALLQEYYFTNVVACRPPDNRDPIPKEIEACRTRLLEQIYTVDPIYIITAGKIASEALIGKKVAITSMRGELHDVSFKGRSGIEYNYPVLPVLHPSYLLRKNDFKQEGGDTEKTMNDFLKIMHRLDEYNLRHYGIPKPILRPAIDKKRH